MVCSKEREVHTITSRWILMYVAVNGVFHNHVLEWQQTFFQSSIAQNFGWYQEHMWNMSLCFFISADAAGHHPNQFAGSHPCGITSRLQLSCWWPWGASYLPGFRYLPGPSIQCHNWPPWHSLGRDPDEDTAEEPGLLHSKQKLYYSVLRCCHDDTPPSRTHTHTHNCLNNFFLWRQVWHKWL